MYGNDKAKSKAPHGFKSITLNPESSVVMIKPFAMYISDIIHQLSQKCRKVFLLQAVSKANKPFLYAIDKFLMDLFIRHGDPSMEQQTFRNI